jgi:GTPase SAR1 family protein
MIFDPTYLLMSNLQQGIISKISTGDSTLDIFLALFTTNVILYILSNIKKIREIARKLWLKLRMSDMKYIEYEGHIIIDGNKVKCNLPTEIIGINAWIIMKSVDIGKIKIIKDDDPENELKFLIEDCADFELDDDLYMTTYQYSRISEDSKIIYTTYILRLGTRNLKIVDILKIVDGFRDVIEDYCRERRKKNGKYFIYCRNDEELPKCDFKYEQYKIDNNMSFDNLEFEGKYLFLEKINRFLNGKEIYKKMGKPYTLGILLYGEPGCGKTSIIKAISDLTGRYVQDIPLHRIRTCTELRRMFFHDYLNNNKIPIEKRIITMEDIDCLGNIVLDRENNIITNESNIDDSLNLSVLLNILDGLVDQSGRIIIMTTNHIERLDKALVRSGRIDIKLEMKHCTEISAKKIIKQYFEDDDSIEKLKIPEMKFTPADIVNFCFGSENLNDLNEKIQSNKIE